MLFHHQQPMRYHRQWFRVRDRHSVQPRWHHSANEARKPFFNPPTRKSHLSSPRLCRLDKTHFDDRRLTFHHGQKMSRYSVNFDGLRKVATPIQQK